MTDLTALNAGHFYPKDIPDNNIKKLESDNKKLGDEIIEYLTHMEFKELIKLYLGDNTGKIKCFDMNTGKILKKYQIMYFYQLVNYYLLILPFWYLQ